MEPAVVWWQAREGFLPPRWLRAGARVPCGKPLPEMGPEGGRVGLGDVLGGVSRRWEEEAGLAAVLRD